MTPSPCTKRCKIIDHICQGCGRSLDDISKWKYCSDVEKDLILSKSGKLLKLKNEESKNK